MVRLRFFTRSPDGLRPWVTGAVLLACGPAAAASSSGETLDSAVTRELDAIRAEAGLEPAGAAAKPDAIPKPLPATDGGAVRPVSGQVPPQPPAPPKTPTDSQLEVMRQLEEMYKRDGREMPSMRLKDAPNTRLPNGQRPVLVPRDSSAPAAPTIQPAAAAAEQRYRPPAPATVAPIHSDRQQAASEERPSWWDRLRGKSGSSSTSPQKSSGGFFSKLMSPFRRDEKPRTMYSKVPPTPPPMPELDAPSRYAAQPPAAPQALPAMPARTMPQSLPPIGSEAFAVQPPRSSSESRTESVSAAASLPAPVREREANPFMEVTEPRMAITPAADHPITDAFSEIRGDEAPAAIGDAQEAPVFVDAEPADPGAPRQLDPETVSDPDGFAEVRLEAPPAAESKQEIADRYTELQRKLAERVGLGGFQGFCPVALRDRRELIDSRPEFLSVYKGRTYELSSAESKARFEANPTKYAPMNGGNDVVLTDRGETEVEGNLAHAVWFKDRLYLFRSPETLKEFNAAPSRYAVDE